VPVPVRVFCVDRQRFSPALGTLHHPTLHRAHPSRLSSSTTLAGLSSKSSTTLAGLSDPPATVHIAIANTTATIAVLCCHILVPRFIQPTRPAPPRYRTVHHFPGKLLIVLLLPPPPPFDQVAWSAARWILRKKRGSSPPCGTGNLRPPYWYQSPQPLPRKRPALPHQHPPWKGRLVYRRWICSMMGVRSRRAYVRVRYQEKQCKRICSLCFVLLTFLFLRCCTIQFYSTVHWESAHPPIHPSIHPHARTCPMTDMLFCMHLRRTAPFNPISFIPQIS
jgi:hypothetical protein